MLQLEPNGDAEYRLIVQLLYRIFQPVVYLEVGVLNGDTINTLVPLAREFGGRLLGIDLQRQERVHSCVEFFQRDSSLIGPEWSIPLDMVFIDADHSKDAVLRDFNDFFKWLNPGCLMLMHDTYPPSEKSAQPGLCGTAWQAAWELRQRKSDEYEILTFPTYYGLTVIRKSKTQVP
jgi:cephalosporin hydroxylase